MDNTIVPGSNSLPYYQMPGQFRTDIGLPEKWDPYVAAKNAAVGLGVRGVQQVAFGNSVEPERQAAIRRAITATDPANATAQIDQFGKYAVSTAADAARQTDASLRSAGLSSGLREGATSSAFSNAQRATSQFAGSVLSSEGQLNALQAHLQAIGLAQDPEIVQLMAQLALELKGTPKTSLFQGLAGTIGQLGGAAIAAGA